MVAGADFNIFIFVRRAFNFCANFTVSAVYLYVVLVEYGK